MKQEQLYELLKDFEDPNGRISKGVRKTASQWCGRFALLNQSDCDVKTDWFKLVQQPVFNEDDMLAFAEFIMQRTFPKSDEPQDLYFKWRAVS
jgi:hypothetical protein